MSFGHSHEIAAVKADALRLKGGGEHIPSTLEKVQKKYGLISVEAYYASNYSQMLSALTTIAPQLFLGRLLPGTEEGQMQRYEDAVADIEALRTEIEVAAAIGSEAVATCETQDLSDQLALAA